MEIKSLRVLNPVCTCSLSFWFIYCDTVHFDNGAGVRIWFDRFFSFEKVFSLSVRFPVRRLAKNLQDLASVIFMIVGTTGSSETFPMLEKGEKVRLGRSRNDLDQALLEKKVKDGVRRSFG